MSDTKLNTLEQPEVMAFFDAQTNTISYIVKDPSSTACAVIDSVMNMDYAAGRITFESADEIVKTIKDQGLELQWIIETHVHADHLSAAPICKSNWAARSASVRKSSRCRTPLARSSMKEPHSNAMDHNLMRCLKMGTAIMWGKCKPPSSPHLAILRPVWCMSWAMRLLSATLCLCPMVDRRALISRWGCRDPI